MGTRKIVSELSEQVKDIRWGLVDRLVAPRVNFDKKATFTALENFARAQQHTILGPFNVNFNQVWIGVPEKAIKRYHGNFCLGPIQRLP